MMQLGDNRRAERAGVSASVSSTSGRWTTERSVPERTCQVAERRSLTSRVGAFGPPTRPLLLAEYVTTREGIRSWSTNPVLTPADALLEREISLARQG